MKRLILLATAVATLGLLAACEPATESGASSPEQLAERISADRIRNHIEFLADDLLEGRETGSRGYEIAAKYVETQYKLLGLEPAGEDGGYYQQVEFRRAIPEQARFSISMNGETRQLEVPADLAVSGNYHSRAAELSGRLVFVGNGVSAPEFDYDDYAGVDLDGNIAVMMRYGSAVAVPEGERAHFSSPSTRIKAAMEHGAIGVIFIYRPSFAERASWEWVAGSISDGSLSWLGKDGSVPDTYAGLRMVARASFDFGAELMTSGGQDVESLLAKIDAGEVVSFEIPGSLEGSYQSRWEDFSSPNVVGVLPGADPDKFEEYVLYSGHLDAVGMDEPDEEDESADLIRNGAYDNATGIGIMLEVARVFAGMEQRPDRSIVFLAVTGEEQGLFGSEYWAEYPTVPIDKVSANVNLDMPVLTFPLADVIAYGAEHSEMEDIVRRQAGKQGLELSPDPWPEQRIFTRSDQYSFVKVGVPAVFLVPGWTSTDPDIDGEQMMRSFEEEHYHQPSDDLSRPYDRDSAKRFAAANFLIGLEIANREDMVAWWSGDYFGEQYGTRFVGAGEAAEGTSDQ